MAATLVQPGIEPVARSIQAVTVIGAGVAGLSAACALADSGYRVRLLERRGYAGGRASSYEHPGTGEIIDNCQHILLGCCTNLIDLYRRLRVEDCIQWFDQVTFVEPEGRRSVLKSSPFPAPLHSAVSFLRAQAFSFREKLAIAQGLMAFLRGTPAGSDEPFSDWLVRHKQPPRAIERFWRPILVSALNEDTERISVRYAAQVIRESFLRSPEGGRMGIPAIPLSELYGKAAEYIAARGGELVYRAGAELVEMQGDAWVVSSGQRSYSSEAIVLALSFEGMSKLLPRLPTNAEAELLAGKLAQFEHSPITCVHLWFDREITDLHHAVLLETKFDWMFYTSRLQPARHQGSYLELLVSASRFTLEMSQRDLVELACRELAVYFPLPGKQF